MEGMELPDLGEISLPKLRDKATTLKEQVIPMKEDIDRIINDLTVANARRSVGQDVDLDWMHRAGTALYHRRRILRRVKAELKHINIAIMQRLASGTDTEQSLARKQLHEETLKAANLKRELEVERMRLTLEKKKETEARRFMRAARHMLDPSVFATVQEKAGITASEN